MTQGIVQPVVTPSSPQLTDTAVMVSNAGDCDRLRRAMGHVGVPGRGMMMSRLYHQPDRWSVVGPVVGAPYAAMVVETLIAWGARRFIYVGWCGAIDDSLAIGDWLIPDAAWVDEGTSPHYGVAHGQTAAPDAEWSARLTAGLSADGVPMTTGSVWTTDAIFRETPEQVDHYKQKGAVAVEMEASAVMSVARFHGMAAAVVLVVSDSLADGTWRPGFKDPRFGESRKALAAAIAVLPDTLSSSDETL